MKAPVRAATSQPPDPAQAPLDSYCATEVCFVCFIQYATFKLGDRGRGCAVQRHRPFPGGSSERRRCSGCRAEERRKGRQGRPSARSRPAGRERLRGSTETSGGRMAPRCGRLGAWAPPHRPADHSPFVRQQPDALRGSVSSLVRDQVGCLALRRSGPWRCRGLR